MRFLHFFCCWGNDVFYHQGGVLLTMPVLLVVARLCLVLEDDYLLSPNVADGSSHNFGTLDGGVAHFHAIVVGYEQYLVQFDHIARSRSQEFCVERFARRHPDLFAAGFNYCVNGIFLHTTYSHETSHCSHSTFIVSSTT